ncbi:hypothetical protein HDU86_001171 [Geranomyces michiganensis]|nr:hypothetical protein HDU86_001171 [Geranomyces michiganensis]
MDSNSSSGIPAAAAASLGAHAQYTLPPSWRGGAGQPGDQGGRRGGGGGKGGRGGNRGGGWRGGRGGGGGASFYNPRYEPYPREQRVDSQPHYTHDLPAQPPFTPYVPQHEVTMSQAYANSQPIPEDPRTQYSMLQLQQQQLMEQQRSNLALLPAALRAMAGHFSGLLQQQQQQQMHQHQQQNFQHHHQIPPQSSQQQPHQTMYGAAYGPAAALPQSIFVDAASDPPRFRCEGCDKGFQIESQYRTHCETHVKCDHCDFQASQRVVRTHAETEHAEILEGAKPAYVSKDSPEEIAQWIADRKKKYPTEANIQAKQAQMEARIARGELPDPSNKLRGQKHARSRKEKKIAPPAAVIAAADSAPVTGLGLLAGYASDISSGSNKNKGSDSDSDSDGDSDSSSSDSSDLDSLDEHEGLLARTPNNKPLTEKRKGPICRYFKMNRCRKGDACSFRHELPPPKSKSAQSRQPQIAEHNRKPLLRMLLENDIRKEKSMVLQSIRYLLQTAPA